jgi:2-polyprenyl-3-methyl-5-hydroxy-6-metoxy-1,4-benzoquinol methylase
MNDDMQAHYNAFLVGRYYRASGGMEDQIQKNQEFFTSHVPKPHDNRAAIDLGAGCGFPVPLAVLGYSVTAVDFCQPLLDELRLHAGTLPVVTVQSDILTYSSWSGRHPALIVCMGDTLTHLPAPGKAEDLIRVCWEGTGPRRQAGPYPERLFPGAGWCGGRDSGGARH